MKSLDVVFDQISGYIFIVIGDICQSKMLKSQCSDYVVFGLLFLILFVFSYFNGFQVLLWRTKDIQSNFNNEIYHKNSPIFESSRTYRLS